MNISELLEGAGVVPIVVIEDASKAVPTAQALLAGGIRTMEITFRTACAADAVAPSPRRFRRCWSARERFSP